MKKDDRFYLLHVRDSVQAIFEFTKEGKERFFSDRKTQDAVVRNLEIIGEAVKNISGLTKSSYTEIPWKQIAGMRDKLIHDYFGVNLTLVWDSVVNELPQLNENISLILRDLQKFSG
jgi:uncharacterized protein with HEPN domain